MRILICIDDTDNLESRGTGALASQMAEELEENGWGKSSFITRHQLFVHPDIPYTSHNSSMCFAADIDDIYLESIIGYASDFLVRESAVGSDPGLCVVTLDRLESPDLLIAFGRKAKESVLTMEEAYDLAEHLGIHLSDHGGTGQGIIGALAGIGLRLSGNDGRLKGAIKIKALNGMTSVDDICALPEVDEVRSLCGAEVKGPDVVKLGEKPKTVLLDGKSVFLVVPAEGAADGVHWQSCPRQLLKKY
ncbi:MAG: hypothetical protein HYS23_13055 [Geobacter sp.]|nr:hypothetical protein [Geobacter sp.]